MNNIYNRFFDPDIYAKVNQDNIDLMEDFLLELKQNKKSPGTISQYKSDIRGMFCWIYKKLNNRSILELNKKDFRNFSLYLTSDCGLSTSRHNRFLSSVRSLLSFAENEDDYEYDTNISKKVRGLAKEPVREIFFLTNEQILKLRDALIERKKYQYATLLMLAYDSAGRKAELSQVKKDSFYDPTKNNTNRVIGKRRKQFSLVYFSGTKHCADLWLEQRGKDDIDSLWISGDSEHKHPATKENIYEWFMHMRDLLTELEGKETEFNVHSLRHSCLQALSDNSHYICQELGMKNGFPLEKLKLIANHSDVSTTSHYLKDSTEDELSEMFSIKISQ